jgi:ribosome-binding factor A
VSLRRTPALVFEYDGTEKRASRIEQLLAENKPRPVDPQESHDE